MRFIKRTITLLAILIFLCIPAQATLKFATGFESNSTEGYDAPPIAGISAVTSPKRSGAYALKATTASNLGTWEVYTSLDSSGNIITSFMSSTFAFQVGVLPNTTSAFFGVSCASARLMYIKLDTSGHVLLGSNAAGDGSASSGTITADGLWHTVQVKFDAASTDVRVDGTDWATYSTTASGCNQAKLGVAPDNVTDTTATYYYDDLVATDSGSVYAPISSLIFLPAISDNARGSWIAGAGGTTNLYDAINNFPPVGVLNASATNTSQIKNSTGGGNQDGTWNVMDYTTGGVPSTATIDFVYLYTMGGRQTSGAVATGLWIASNPTQGATGTSTKYSTAGGLGTYNAGWRIGIGAFAVSPAVTRGTNPTITIRKATNTTNVVHVCWAGIYVGYTPAVSGCSQSIALMGVGCR